MSIRWLMCLAISLTAHVVWLCRGDLFGGLKPQDAIVAVAVAEAKPISLVSQEAAPPEPTPVPQEPPAPEPATAEADKYRPNVEPQEPEQEPAEEPDQQPRQEPEQDSPEVEPTEGSALEAAVATAEERKKEIETYRGRLLEQFDEQWQQVPELNTVIQDVASLPGIDEHFGIVILAYSYVDHKPGPPFLLFNVKDGTAEKLDRFDFTQFSNRIKDRMLYAQYRTWLDEARRQHNINSLMKVIGLVPAPADHYFCAKQLRAIQLAGVPLSRARVTNGHYEPDGAGGYNLVIDSVTATDGRTIGVQDEELRFSVVARKQLTR